jgi:hypothetical protein
MAHPTADPDVPFDPAGLAGKGQRLAADLIIR